MVDRVILWCRNCLYLSSLDSFLKWPGIAKFKLFTWLDELSTHDGFGRKFISNFDKLKPFITDKRVDAEVKFRNTENVANYNRWITCTNNENPIPMKAGIDRRFCLIKVSSEKKGDKEYFTQLSKVLNQEAANHFFTWLVTKVNLEDYNPEDFPKGDAH